MSIEEILKVKREEILRICAKHGAHDVRIFGSVARGEADENSDLDLMVRFDRGRSLLDHAGLIIDLEEFLGCKVDVVSENGIKARMRDRVFAEAIAL